MIMIITTLAAIAIANAIATAIDHEIIPYPIHHQQQQQLRRGIGSSLAFVVVCSSTFGCDRWVVDKK
jgi:hypothetical protein